MSAPDSGNTLLTLVIIPSAAVFLPAVLGLYYFISQRNYEKATIANAIGEEMHRLRDVLKAHLAWVEKPTSPKLPLLPFETSVYDAQLNKLGILSPAFAKRAVSFYGMVHFINALQRVKESYDVVDAGELFQKSYQKAIRRALDS